LGDVRFLLDAVSKLRNDNEQLALKLYGAAR
jgi:hypothetical protein